MQDSSAQDTHLAPQGMRQAGPQVSKMRFYSIALVAHNKPLQSKEVEATPMEEMPMLDGFLDDKLDPYSGSGEDSAGKGYSAKIDMARSIKATWVPFGASNRLTAPDVRRGEMIMLYQFGDADKFYWTTLKDDNRLRKLETAVYAFSGTREENVNIGPQNSYYLEVSTHTKQITLHTSQADKEPFGYDIQINTGDGRILIIDTAGNKFLLDSQATQLRMENAVGSFLDITKQVATLTAADQVTINTKNMTINGSSVINLVTPNLRSP